MPGHGAIDALLANLSNTSIKVCKGEVVIYIHFMPSYSYTNTTELGTLKDFNIPCQESINIVDPLLLSHLEPKQKEEVLKLFEKYKDVFLVGNHYLGCAKSVVHKLEIWDSDPIKSRAI